MSGQSKFNLYICILIGYEPMVLRILYLIYYWLIAMPLFIVCTILTALIVMIGCTLGGRKFFSFYPGMIWSRITCYITLCPVKVRGREHLRRGQSYVFAANHQGAFDIFLLYGFLGVPVKWMMKIGIYKIPFVGWACRSAGFIFVDNSSPRAALKSIKDAERRLKDGASLAVFPEGSRSPDGRMKQFRKGAFQIARNLKLPIVPVSINGSFHALPTGSITVHPHRLEVVIHPPLTVENDHPVDLQTLSDRTWEVIGAEVVGN